MSALLDSMCFLGQPWWAWLILAIVMLIVMAGIAGSGGSEDDTRDMAYGYIIYSDDPTISPARRQHARESYNQWMADTQARNRRRR